jgi:FkbM family methyltransferase
MTSIGRHLFNFERLRRALGWRNGVTLTGQLLVGYTTVSFRDRGRTYWMPNDRSVVYALCSSVQTLRRLASYVQSSDRLVVDVGAHSGLFTAFAAERATDALVIAVEPDPHLVSVIRTNTRSLPPVELHCVAIGDATGSAILYRNPDSTQTNSMLRDAVASFGDRISDIQVQMKTIDDIVGNRVVDVLKIDVQGAEHLAIRGATSTLGRVRTVLIEVSFLSPGVLEVLAVLTELFGDPEVVNLVTGGADLAFSRAVRSPKEEVRHDLTLAATSL